jgi:hypothetical protein
MSRKAFRFSFQDAALEQRELLSAAPATADVAPLTTQQAPEALPPINFFHKQGINGLRLKRTFTRPMNYRLSLSKTMTNRIAQSFQVFQQAYFIAAGAEAQPAVPLGNPAMPPTLPNLLNDMVRQVAAALSTIEITNSQAGPSLVKERKFAPLSLNALVPFSLEQIDLMGQTLAGLPSTFAAGSPTSKAVNAAINKAYNAILNAVAEYSLHPGLFLSPADFYLNPNISFTINFTSTPAAAAPGYFVRGPGGVLLPGALLHPHLPVQ